MAAHNEEKIIINALENLSHLPCDSYEVILGLDGCSDRTLEIVQSYKKKQPKIFHYYELNERKGKPAVINKIFPHAKGDIIILHDADWIFRVRSKESMDEFLSWFNDPQLGGVVESYPIEWNTRLLQETKDWAYLASAYGTYHWLTFMKKKFSITKDGIRYVDPASKNLPFLCNVFRRELYAFNETLADDFERSLDILQRGYDLRILDYPKQPRMIAGYTYQTFKDLTKQKTRTARAREQVFAKYDLHVTFFNFYLPLLLYASFSSLKSLRLRNIIATHLWITFTLYGATKQLFTFEKKDTKESWLLRAQRQ